MYKYMMYMYGLILQPSTFKIWFACRPCSLKTDPNSQWQENGYICKQLGTGWIRLDSNWLDGQFRELLGLHLLWNWLSNLNKAILSFEIREIKSCLNLARSVCPTLPIISELSWNMVAKASKKVHWAHTTGKSKYNVHITRTLLTCMHTGYCTYD